MIVSKVLNEIRKYKSEGGFTYPFYEKYCFANIPATIFSLFDIETERASLPAKLYRKTLKGKAPLKVVLILIDALGFNQWLKHCQSLTFWDVLKKKGLVVPLTTVFPSTTAAALTTISTGLTPQEHGLLEWHLYLKQIDQIIETLPFTPLGEKQFDKLLDFGIDPKILFQGKTIYQKLKKTRISSFIFANRNYGNSSYSELISKGAKRISFINFSDLVVNLRKALEETREKSYFFVYWDALDSIGHDYGPKSEQSSAEFLSFSYLLRKELLEKISPKVAEETILLITADHGQVDVSPEKTVYLNKYQHLIGNFQVSKNGKSILPTGNARDVFLQIKPKKLEETFRFLSKELKEKAKVMKTAQAIKMGFFGAGQPSKRFRERVGNLLILPYKNYTIWYEHIKGKKFEHLGCHGGLSEEEMLVPFAIARASDLI